MTKINILSPGARSDSRWTRLRAIDFNAPRTLAVACVVVPLLFGLYSLWLGADSNWDLYNYHLYNAFSLLHGKLHIDFAPAGMQSYFNPLLDVPYYLISTHLPARLVGSLMGVLHGLNFVLLLSIAQQALPALPDKDRYRIPLLLALAGCLTANFLSGLGNSMGDDTTALFSLAALLIVLSNWERLAEWRWRSAAISVSAGLIAGLGVGLKFTNGSYAVALCIGLLTYPAAWVVRLRLCVQFGIGTLLGITATGGYWMFELWRTFGNPLFPQFSTVFPNPLTREVTVIDSRWLPKGLLETALWPFIFTLDSRRVGQVSIHQIIWSIVYLLFWWWMAVMLGGRQRTALEPRARYVVVFVAVGYLVWMKLFSIYRYIVPIEMAAPLVAFILLSYLLPYFAARRVAIWTLGVATLIVVAGGAKTWGHQGWSEPMFHADVPHLTYPARTTILIVGGASPAGWLVTFFPPNVAFAQLQGSFPESPAFGARIREIVTKRGGPTFAIVNGAYNWRIDNIAKTNALIARTGLTKSEWGCEAIRWAVSRLRLHATVLQGSDTVCKLGLRTDDEKDLASENRRYIEQAALTLKRYGFILEPATRSAFKAGIGQGTVAYQWCRVRLR